MSCALIVKPDVNLLCDQIFSIHKYRFHFLTLLRSMWISYQVVWICSQSPWHWFEWCRRFVQEWLEIAICLRAGYCPNLHHTAVFESCNWNKFLDNSKLYQTWRAQNFMRMLACLRWERHLFSAKDRIFVMLENFSPKIYTKLPIVSLKTISKYIPMLTFIKPHFLYDFLFFIYAVV